MINDTISIPAKWLSNCYAGTEIVTPETHPVIYLYTTADTVVVDNLYPKTGISEMYHDDLIFLSQVEYSKQIFSRILSVVSVDPSAYDINLVKLAKDWLHLRWRTPNAPNNQICVTIELDPFPMKTGWTVFLKFDEHNGKATFRVVDSIKGVDDDKS